MNRFSTSIMFLLASMLLTISGQTFSADLQIGNYQLVKKERVSRTDYIFTYQADITNSASYSYHGVSAQLTSNSPYTTPVDANLTWNNDKSGEGDEIEAGETRSSIDTFSFRHNRRIPFSWDALVWDISNTADDSDHDGISDNVDNCPAKRNTDQKDTDSDGIGDKCDDDRDNDGIANSSDLNDYNPSICADVDNDTCDDCSIGVDGYGPLADNDPYNDGPDYNSNGICNLMDPIPDSDYDGFNDEVDNCPYKNNRNQNDHDRDGIGDKCDPDKDNDGIENASDLDRNNPNICADADRDGCDDCSIGVDGYGPLADNDPYNDGPDHNNDGICYLLDPDPTADTDNDGLKDNVDNCPGTSNPDQADLDQDGRGDQCDVDMDNDGVANFLDRQPFNPRRCKDVDEDGCDDCNIGKDQFGPLADSNRLNDGEDHDNDGICDVKDPISVSHHKGSGFGKSGFPNESDDSNFINFKAGQNNDYTVRFTNDTNKKITLTKIINTGRIVNVNNWNPAQCLKSNSPEATPLSKAKGCVFLPGESGWIFYIEQKDDKKSNKDAYFRFNFKIGNASEIGALTMHYNYKNLWGLEPRDNLNDTSGSQHKLLNHAYTSKRTSSSYYLDGTQYVFAAGKGKYAPNIHEITTFAIHSKLSDRYIPQATQSDVDKLNVMTFNMAAPEVSFLWLSSERNDALGNNGLKYFKNVDVLILTEAGTAFAGKTDAKEVVREKLCCGAGKPFQKYTTILNGWPIASMGDNGGVVILTKGNGLATDPIVRNILQFPLLIPSATLNSYTYSLLDWPDDKELHYKFTDKERVPLGDFEYLSPKGVLKARYTKTVAGKSQDYYIVASHTTSGTDPARASARYHQLHAMRKIADDLPDGARIIYAGDFNTEPKEIPEMLNILGVDSTNGQYTGYSANDYNFYHLLQDGYQHFKRLDWILPYGEQKYQLDAVVRAMTMRHPGVAPFDLSDHDAVLAEFDYSPND